MALAVGSDNIDELSNAAKISLAMQFRDLEVNPDLMESTPIDQLIVDCMMDDYSDINFEDPALLGLFTLLGVAHDKIPSLKVSEFIELMWRGDSGAGGGWFVGDIFANPGTQMMLEASMVKGGLKTINQLFKYAGRNPLSIESIQRNGLTRIDPEESNRKGGDLYSIMVRIHDYDYDDEDSPVQEYYSTELYLTTELSHLFEHGQLFVDSAINELKDDLAKQQSLHLRITEITIFINGQVALVRTPDIDLRVAEKQEYNTLNTLSEFEIFTSDKRFIDQVMKSQINEHVVNKLKGMALENALGL